MLYLVLCMDDIKKDIMIGLLRLEVDLLHCLLDNRYDPDVIELADGVIAWYDQHKIDSQC